MEGATDATRQPAGKSLSLGLGTRVFLAFVLVLLLGEGITGLLVDRRVQQIANVQVRERLTYEVTMLGQITANALFGAIEPGDTSLSEVVKQLASAVHTNLSILAPDGTVVADSDVADLARLGPLTRQVNTQEIQDAMTTGRGASVRDVGGVARMFVAEAIVRDGKTLGFARASVPMTAVNSAAREARVQMAVGGLAAAAGAVVIAGFLVLGIIRPVRKLAAAARRVGAGDLSHRIDVRTNDEIGALASALNEMVRRLEVMLGTLDRRNRDMRLVLDNVAQGLVTVDRDGAIADERSMAIDKWFGAPKAGTKLWEIFADADANARWMLSLGWSQLFEGVLPLELAIDQLPRRIRCGERIFELGCEPLKNGLFELDRCLVVLSDVTAVVAAERTQAEQHAQLRLFAAVAKDREGVQSFLNETGRIVDDVIANASDPSKLVEVKRGIHTIKGNAGLFGLTTVSELCEAIETRLAEEPDAVLSRPESDAVQREWRSIAARADELLGTVSADAVDVAPHDVDDLVTSIRNGRSPDVLVRAVATWSLERADRRLGTLAEQARQLAARMGKRVSVTVEPTRVRVNGKSWAGFWASLPHVLRNALDHGIESTDDRSRAGKPALGEVRLSATEGGDRVVVEIRDDGRGIDWVKLREKANAARLPATTQADLVGVLFTGGISTRDRAGEYSGRGIGLSAVYATCKAMGARVEVESSAGKGTTLRFVFPKA